LKSLADEAWNWLGRELDAWGDSGARAEFWWRDDDAIEITSALQRLADLSRKQNAAVSIAVIPATMDRQLQNWVSEQRLITVLQHGYAHHNHALAGQRKLELGGQQNQQQILAQLELGRDRLVSTFGERFVPVLVPPWNRFDTSLLDALPGIGFCGISTMKVRKQAYPATSLLQVNTHLDPVNWRHQSGFIGIYPAIAILIQHLQAKRNGYRDADEPTGLLTHHLAQDDAVWHFAEQLLEFVNAHPAAVWIDSHNIWR